jgi:hypothetical protein
MMSHNGLWSSAEPIVVKLGSHERESCSASPRPRPWTFSN